MKLIRVVSARLEHGLGYVEFTTNRNESPYPPLAVSNSMSTSVRSLAQLGTGANNQHQHQHRLLEEGRNDRQANGREVQSP
jgi:hypothetical protein